MKQVNIRIPLRILALMMGLILSIGAYAQNITVQGHVKDATGEPVIGATVTQVGTTNVVATDFDGNFTITVPKGAQLQVSSIGLQDQTVTAAPNLIIEMLDDAQVLENVVVIGYGTVKKSDLTGSVTALRPDAKNKGVVVSAQDMLNGKVAGVSVTSDDGAPGGSATIRIRGGSSLNASNNPLIVIDGIAMDNNGISGVSNPLSLVNPQDIESFNVLKDASATAIYGSRGSNGVIIITTKKGRRGQTAPQVSYNGSVTWSMKKKTIKVMNGDEYRAFVTQAFENDTRKPNVMGYAWRNAKNPDGKIEMLRNLNTLQNGQIVNAKVSDIALPEGWEWVDGDGNQGFVNSLLGNANTDWQNEIYRTALSHDHNITVAGSAGDFLPYRLSLGYTDQQGILKTSDYKRYTVAVNLSPSLLNDHLTMNLNGKLAWTKSRFAATGAVGNAVRMDPTQPVRSDDAKYAGVGGYFDWLQVNNADPAWPYTKNTNAPYNPVAMLDNHDNSGKTRSFIGSADIDYKIHGFEDLRLHLTLGGDFTHGEGHNISANISNTSNYYGNTSYYTQSKENLQLSTYAQYYKDFADKHHFDIMAGYEWQHNWRKEYNESWGTYPTNSALKFGADDALVVAPGTWIPSATYKVGDSKAGAIRGEGVYRQNNGLGYRTENYLVSFFGRMNYIYDSKYYLTFTMRYDGSSRFKKHWALFPSAALAWNIAEEAFMKDGPFSTLKLRLGWGKTGQQEGIGDYNYFANYVMSNGSAGAFYDLIGEDGKPLGGGYKAKPNVYNPELKWETTTTTNVGLDWGVMNGRLTGSIDWYYRKTTDLLNWATFSAMTNFRNAFYKNIGSLRNTGIEFSVNWKAISTNDLLWTLDYNLTYNSNKVTELISNDPDYFVSTGSIGINGNAQAHFVDHPSHSFYVYQQVYDQNGKPIEGQVVDRNADGVISEADKYLYKSPWAPVTMGFASKLEWKNWDFGFSLRASLGNYLFNNVMQGYHNVSNAAIFEEVSGFYLNNRPVESVNMGWQTYDNETVFSDYWVQNASFLKCDNITLGYSFNELFKSGGYHGLGGRVYGTVSNVFCITKYDGIDPEIFGGIGGDIFPRPISFILGLSLNF